MLATNPARLEIEGAHAIRRAATLSLAAALGLSVLKVVGWRASGSVALLASLVDSALDILAAAGTLFAVQMALRPPDAEHRYGHGKVEAFAGLLQAALVLVSAFLIGREAVGRLAHPVAVQFQGLALGVMVLSTLVAAGLVAVQGRALAQGASLAVESDRTHYLADIGANLVALAGLAVVAVLHLPVADAAAGLLVSIWLAWGAWTMGTKSADCLMDRELDDADRDAVMALIYEDAVVLDVHDLRTRASGPIVHVQAHVAMAPDMSIDAAHRILVEAERRILARFPAADILLQPDPHGRAEPHAGAFAEAVRDGGAFARMTPEPKASRKAE